MTPEAEAHLLAKLEAELKSIESQRSGDFRGFTFRSVSAYCEDKSFSPGCWSGTKAPRA
jgi:hypothetical protein